MPINMVTTNGLVAADCECWAQALLDGQLLLMDAGCERHGYASDVTRCWPVNGRFSSEQAAVYQAVQHVHRWDFLRNHVDLVGTHKK